MFLAQAPLERTLKWAPISFFLPTAVSGGLCRAVKRSWKNKLTNKNYDVMVLVARIPRVSSTLAALMGWYLEWFCEGTWLTMRCLRTGHSLGFGEKSDVISLIIWHAFLLNALIGGIFLATYYKHFMECGWFLCRLPPLSMAFILHFWYPGLLSVIKGMFPLEKMMHL